MTLRTTLLAAAGAVLLAAGAAAAGAQEPVRQRVTLASGGETLVGDLYLPAGHRPGDRLPAVVVAGPWLTVKEQTAGTYARALAARGIAALAFDFRFFGESGGEPRQFESPVHKGEDLHAALAFLRAHPAVDGARVGALGICFGAGYVARVAAEDPSLASMATVAAWLHDPASLDAVFGADEVRRRRAVGQAALARWEAERVADHVPAHSTTDREAAMFRVDFYADPARGAIPAWTNRMAVMSWPGWLDLDGASYAPRIRAPLMVVHSDGSALPALARRLYDGAAGPKELVWLEGNHTDFYDREPYVTNAADAVARHFRATLGGGAPARGGA